MIILCVVQYYKSTKNSLISKFTIRRIHVNNITLTTNIENTIVLSPVKLKAIHKAVRVGQILGL